MKQLKAIVGAVTSGLSALMVALSSESIAGEVVTLEEMVGVVLALIAGHQAVYWTPNKDRSQSK